MDALPASLPHAPGALPFLRDGAVQPLHLAVPPQAVGPRVNVPGLGRGERLVKLPAGVARAAVGHHPIDGEAESCIEAQLPAHEGRANPLALVREQLRVGDAAEVVDREVQAGGAGARMPPRGVVDTATSSWANLRESQARLPELDGAHAAQGRVDLEVVAPVGPIERGGA